MPGRRDEQPVRAWTVRIDVEAHEGVAVMTLAGRLSSRTAPAVAEALASAGPTQGPVVLDLTGLDYLSSAGLRVLREAAAAREVVIGGASTAVQIALDLAGSAPELPIEPDLRRALDRVRRNSSLPLPP